MQQSFTSLLRSLFQYKLDALSRQHVFGHLHTYLGLFVSVRLSRHFSKEGQWRVLFQPADFPVLFVYGFCLPQTREDHGLLGGSSTAHKVFRFL